MKMTTWSASFAVLLAIMSLAATAAAEEGANRHSFELSLGGLRFDPLTDFPDLPSAGHHREHGGANFRLIQFDGPIRREWLQAVRGQGIEVVHYIHPYAYVVWADAAQLAMAGELNGVRWTGEFAVEFRVLPHQRERGAAALATMALVSRHAGSDNVRRALEAAGAEVVRITRVTSHTDVVTLRIAGDRYLDLGRIPGVYTVQTIPPETATRGEMSNQAIVGHYGPPPGNEIFPGYAGWLTDTGYDGSGVIVGVVDGGMLTVHQDIEDRMSDCEIASVPSSCIPVIVPDPLLVEHGTHVGAAVAGTGATGSTDDFGFLRGQGVAPGANLVAQTFLPFLGEDDGMIPDGMLLIYRESARSGALLTNNSWGPSGSPQGYDIPTQQVDMITRDADPGTEGHQPVLPVWSIMNGSGDSGGACAPSSLGAPDEAKNLLAVGSNNLQTTAGVQMPEIFDVSSNSAHGPACDGRLVPHIVAPGCRTDSATAFGYPVIQHGLLCGTSMASPVVSGAVAIFIERYRDLHGGANPSPALIKAAFTAAAMNLHGFSNADGGVITQTPSRFHGYGRIDLEAVANPPDSVMFFDQEVVFTETGEDWSAAVVAGNPDRPMRLMLAWTDAPGHGLGGVTPAWVNDLDLVVEAGGETWLGNVLGADGYSESGGAADGMNNLEAVFLRSDQHGGAPLIVTVRAANLPGDALNPHDPDAENPNQDFALACYNCQPADPGLTFTVTTSAIGEGSIGPETQEVNEGDDASGTYSADLNWSLDSLDGDSCTPVSDGAGNWTADNITEACAIEANFSLNEYTVDVTANPVDGGTVDGAGTFEHGSQVTVTAEAAEGYNFLNWTEDSDVVSTDAIYEFTIESDRSLVANFDEVIAAETGTEISEIIPSQPIVGQSFEVFVAVTGDEPTGDVTIDVDFDACTVELDEQSQASCTFTATSAGDFTMSAEYLGDTLNEPSSTGPQALTITKDDLNLAISAIDPEDFQVAGFDYEVIIDFGGHDPTGVVVVNDGHGETCEIDLSTEDRCSLSSVEIGETTIMATYDGDDNNNADSAALGYEIVSSGPFELVFAVSPDFGAFEGPLVPGAVVHVLDSLGEVVDSHDPIEITVELEPHVSGGALSGTTSMTISNGQAHFTDLSIDELGDGYRLQASADDELLDPVMSEPFDVILDGVFHDRFEEETFD